jgi:hypothetical protein
MPDIRFAGVQFSNLDRVYIEAQDGKCSSPKRTGRGEADVTQANYSYPCLMCTNFGK